MAFTLPPLPWAKEALAPHISAETLEYHYGKHHQAYVTNLNKLTEGKPEASKSLEDIIQSSEGGQPTGDLADAIKRDFGSCEKFSEEFSNAAATQFGSGWAWLVVGKDKK